MDYLVYDYDQRVVMIIASTLISVVSFHTGSRQVLILVLHTDEVIDETYGVAVQFDEEEEEVERMP